MSKKRTSVESSSDEQTNEDSDSLFQQGNNAKRLKLDSLSYKTLQDLPMELLECILIKVVAMEVKDMKLAQNVWKEKVDLVTGRLRNVCSQWNSILTTNFFRNEVNRILDSSAPPTIRLKILQQSLIQFIVSRVTTLKDEIFMLTDVHDQGNIVVYDRNSLGEETHVIALPVTRPRDIAGCSVSNCVYVLGEDNVRQCCSILRITKDEEHQFNISPWVSDIRLSVYAISVVPNGSLIIVSQQQQGRDPAVVSIYNANGSLQHEIMLSPRTFGSSYIDRVLQKPNGNLLLVSLKKHLTRVLTEIDMEGSIERKYQSAAHGGSSGVTFADSYCRILLVNSLDRIDLFDSEFNQIDFTGPRLRKIDDKFRILNELHYDCERNELLYTYYEAGNKGCSVLTIFRFTEG